MVVRGQKTGSSSIGTLDSIPGDCQLPCIYELHLTEKNRPRCYEMSPAVQDAFQPGLIGYVYTGVSGRWGLLSHAQNAVCMVVALSKVGEGPSKVPSLCAVYMHIE